MAWEKRNGTRTSKLNNCKNAKCQDIIYAQTNLKDTASLMSPKHKNFATECYKPYLRDLLKVCSKSLGIRVDVIAG